MDDFAEYDIKPMGFNNYMRYYGQHLNKALCEYICRQQFDTQYTKDDLINICSNNGYTYSEKTYMIKYIYIIIIEIFCQEIEQMMNRI